jgi:hypothetical protein
MSVPPLIRGGERLQHRLGYAELLAERARHLRVVLDHPVPFGVRARNGSDRGGPARATAGGAATRQGSSIRPFAALSLC